MEIWLERVEGWRSGFNVLPELLKIMPSVV